jgi:hypothetical protein
MRLGRRSTHWRQLSFRMIRRHRATIGLCPVCGRAETGLNDDTKLTVDLIRGGDHTTATPAECRVVCRRCHGRAQGGRGSLENDIAAEPPMAGIREKN